MNRRCSILVTALIMAGCRAGDGDTIEPTRTLGQELMLELQTLTEHVSGRWVVFAAVVIGVTMVLRRWLDLAVRITWRLGWDSQRRMARGRSVLDFTFAAVAALLIVRPFFGLAPLLSSLVAAVAALVIALALPTWIQDFAAGVELATRKTFREGDQIQVGDIEGTVRSIGLFRTRLRHGDGSSMTLPNRLIAGDAIRVGRDTGAVPISVPIPRYAGDDPQIRSQIESLAIVSPFRRAGSTPQLRQTPEGWALVLQTWSTRNSSVVHRALEQQIGVFLAERSESTEAPS